MDQPKGEIVSGPHGYEEKCLITQFRNTSISAEDKNRNHAMCSCKMPQGVH